MAADALEEVEAVAAVFPVASAKLGNLGRPVDTTGLCRLVVEVVTPEESDKFKLLGDLKRPPVVPVA